MWHFYLWTIMMLHQELNSHHTNGIQNHKQSDSEGWMEKGLYNQKVHMIWCHVSWRTRSELQHCSSMLLHWVNKHKLKVKWSRTGPDGVIKPPNCKMFSRAGSRKWQQADQCHKSGVIKKKHSCNITKWMRVWHCHWAKPAILSLELKYNVIDR